MTRCLYGSDFSSRGEVKPPGDVKGPGTGAVSRAPCGPAGRSIVTVTGTITDVFSQPRILSMSPMHSCDHQITR